MFVRIYLRDLGQTSFYYKAVCHLSEVTLSFARHFACLRGSGILFAAVSALVGGLLLPHLVADLASQDIFQR